MKIKTRGRKKKPSSSGIKNEGQYKHAPKGRPREVQGYSGPGVYLYNHLTNELELQEDCSVRFYQDKDTAIEFQQNKGYVIARTVASGLRWLAMRASASNWFEFKAVRGQMLKDGSGYKFLEEEEA